MVVKDQLNRVSDETASTQVEKEIDSVGSSFKNQNRKKWVNCKVVFINNIVRKGGDWAMTGRIISGAEWSKGQVESTDPAGFS